jgi:hypothetical protein
MTPNCLALHRLCHSARPSNCPEFNLMRADILPEGMLFETLRKTAIYSLAEGGASNHEDAVE